MFSHYFVTIIIIIQLLQFVRKFMIRFTHAVYILHFAVTALIKLNDTASGPLDISNLSVEDISE